MNLYESVKSKVTARQAAEHYGIRVNRYGMAVCPFHHDKQPSLKLGQGFYCFGCQARGDVIDFVARYFDMDVRSAAERLADDFAVESDLADMRTVDHKAPERKQREITLADTVTQVYRILTDYYHMLRHQRRTLAPVVMDREWHPLFCEALGEQPRVEMMMDCLLYESEDEKRKMLINYRKKVLEYAERVREYERSRERAAG